MMPKLMTVDEQLKYQIMAKDFVRVSAELIEAKNEVTISRRRILDLEARCGQAEGEVKGLKAAIENLGFAKEIGDLKATKTKLEDQVRELNEELSKLHLMRTTQPTTQLPTRYRG